MVLLCPCSRDQVFVFLVCVFLCSGYLSVVSTSELFVFRFLCSQSIEQALYPMSLRLSRDTTWQNNICFSSRLSCPLPPPFAQTVALGALTDALVLDVLGRILRAAPHWITLHAQLRSSVAAHVDEHRNHTELSKFSMEWAPFAGKSVCDCGRSLALWRVTDAVFSTLARGVCHGKVVFLRCFTCACVYGGHWVSRALPRISE